jgi:hypothetical protein
MDILILTKLGLKEQEIYFRIYFFYPKNDYHVLFQEIIDSYIIFY